MYMWNLKEKRKVKLIEIESRKVVTRGWRMGKIEVGERVEIFS